MNLEPLMIVKISIDRDDGAYVVEHAFPRLVARAKTAGAALAAIAAELRAGRAKALRDRELRKCAEWVAETTGAPYEDALAVVDATVAPRGIAEPRAREANL